VVDGWHPVLKRTREGQYIRSSVMVPDTLIREYDIVLSYDASVLSVAGLVGTTSATGAAFASIVSGTL